MIHCAHASLLHWSLFEKHTPANVQRGQYMIAKAYLLAGNNAMAAEYASKCRNTTDENPEDMKDFDLAYAMEISARISAQAGNQDQFDSWYRKANEAGEAIESEDDKKYFNDDFGAEPWFGMNAQ